MFIPLKLCQKTLSQWYICLRLHWTTGNPSGRHRCQLHHSCVLILNCALAIARLKYICSEYIKSYSHVSNTLVQHHIYWTQKWQKGHMDFKTHPSPSQFWFKKNHHVVLSFISNIINNFHIYIHSPICDDDIIKRCTLSKKKKNRQELHEAHQVIIWNNDDLMDFISTTNDYDLKFFKVLRKTFIYFIRSDKLQLIYQWQILPFLADFKKFFYLLLILLKVLLFVQNILSHRDIVV